MKILLFDNAGMIYCDNDYLVEEKTGKFAKELRDLGNQITFFGQFLPPSTNTVHHFGIKQNGMFFSGLLRRKNKILNYLFLYFRTIPSIYKNDFIYIFYPNSFRYVTFICKLMGKKYGLYLRGMEGIEDFISKKIYKNSFKVYTVSDYFTDLVNRHAGFEVASTIRPMIPYTEKDIIFDRKYNRKQIFNILYIGRISKDKGLVELLYSISKLNESKKNFTLKIVGNGQDMEFIKKISEDLQLNDVISFEGAVYDSEKIMNYYKGADIFVLPSHHEGFPRTLYEAMIFGTPIITTFVGGIPALMKENFNCLKIDVESFQSIVDALNFVMIDYTKIAKIAKNATNTVAEIVDSRRLTHSTMLNLAINDLRTRIK